MMKEEPKSGCLLCVGGSKIGWQVPVGHNTLDNTVACICSAAEITGYKTRHSLHVSLATQLFHEGID